MYELEGLHSILYVMLYGAAAVTALIAALYLLLRRQNAISSDVTPPVSLRRWASAFLFASAASHFWWSAIGTVWLADDRVVRNIINLLLDRLTFMPFMMAMLLRMLQDRRRPVWPLAVALLPLVGIAVWGLINHDTRAEMAIEYYMRFVCVCFIIYYVCALVQYNRWLNCNFADLQHKEVWQSLLFIACILIVYAAYTVFFNGMTSEFVAQVNTFIIIAFILWRVETLQTLEIQPAESVKAPVYVPGNISTLLKERCEKTLFYLQHDITLTQLALAIGTNRTYLSNHFAQQGITYNAYINRLRIDHFVRLYRQADAGATLQQLARQSGYSSYSTFSVNFKNIMGISVAAWSKTQDQALSRPV